MLLEHAKSKIFHERQILKELESVRPDIQNIGKGVKVSRATPSTGMQRTNSSAVNASTGYQQHPVQQRGPTVPVSADTRGSHPPGSHPSTTGMSQSMYAGPVQSQRQPTLQPQSAYPVSSQTSAPPFARGANQQPGFMQYQPSPTMDPLGGAPSSVPPNVHSPPPLGVGPTAQTYNTMSQSLFIPGGSRPPGGYGTARRIDDRAAARSLANMF
jgi:hypothetical protein